MADVDASPNISVPPADDGELTAAIVEAAPDALMVVDGEGRIVRANGRAESLFGYTRSELIGSSIELLMPETFRNSRMG